MPLEAGQPVLGQDLSATYDLADATSVGDAVGIDGSGNLAPADTNAGIDAVGIAAESSGGALGIAGAYVANVASGTAAGERVDTPDASLAGENAGEFVADASGRFETLCAEGGTWQGMSVPSGYAVVTL